MLRSSIPTTNDLLNILRDVYPAMFETVFENVASVLQSYPFTLDARYLEGKRISIFGKLDENLKLTEL